MHCSNVEHLNKWYMLSVVLSKTFCFAIYLLIVVLALGDASSPMQC